MIRGTVTGDREIVIQLEALAPNQSAISIQAVVDTGFNGFLTLPIDVMNALRASAAGTRRAELGDGNLSGVGTRVDVVVRHPDSFWFYEIKTAHSTRACIREAIGQLLEYSYWPKAQEAAKLIVVGETPLDSDGEAYLALLTTRFSIPIEYEHIAFPEIDNAT